MRKGSVTVFVALVFPVLMALLLSIAESARFGGVKLRAGDAGAAAMDSVMAGYNRTLFDRYGLLFYDGGFNEGLVNFQKIEDEFREYFEANTEKRTVFGSGSLFPIGLESAEVTELVTATDYNGEIFMRSALEFFKFDAVGELVEMIKEQVNALGKGDEAKSNAQGDSDRLEKTDWGNRLHSAWELDASVLPVFKIDMEEKVENTPGGNGASGDIHDGNGNETEEPAFDTERFKKDIGKSPIGAAKESKAKGWLALVFPKGRSVSDETVDSSDLPSLTAVDERHLDDRGFLKQVTNKVLFNEYLMANCDCFTDNSKDDGLKYQLEYIIYGDSSDQKNLMTCLNRIMWMREGMNLLFLLSSNHSSEAEDFATGLFGWTENPVIIELATAAILGAWAYAEAIVDTRALLDGKKVAFIKSEETWTLDISNVASLLEGGKFQAKEDKKGIDYRGYLRILLYLSNVNECAYHAMDLIQVSLRKKYGGFMMSAQIYALEFSCEVQARPLFAAIPVVRKTVGRGAEYRFHETYSEVY